MKVKAKFADGKFGFYGGRRIRGGDVLEIADESHFSEKWMVKMEKPRSRSPEVDTPEAVDEGAE